MEEDKKKTQIISERGRIKGSLTRLENNFDNVNTKNETVIRLQRLDELFKDFLRLDSSLSDEDSELAEFEDRYFELKSKYQNKIDYFNSLEATPIAPIHNQISQNIVATQIRLPKLNIPVFSGKFTEWTNFKDMFVSTVHSQSSLSKIQKFQYLKGLLSEEPASLIKHIPLSNESYEEAWEKLLDRYDKKKQIVNSLIKLFLEQKPITNPNSVNIRSLLNTSDEVIRGLKAVSEEAVHRDSWLIYLLFQKLDTESRRLWSIKSAEIEFPTLKEFFDFLNVRCSSLELITSNENVMKPAKGANFVNAKNTNSSTKSFKNCLKCQGVHPLYKCITFKNMDINSRKKFVKNNNLCFLCLNNHRIKECSMNHLKCFKCEGKHNSLLHDDAKGNNVYNVKGEKTVYSRSNENQNFDANKDNISETQINSSASFNNSNSISFLPTAKVLLYNTAGKAFIFRALLDSGSECTFANENVVNILGLRRKNNRITLNGIAGIPAGQTRGSVTLTIGSRISDDSIKVQAFILPKVTSNLPSELLDTKNIEYIKNITLADEEFMNPHECDLILGSDCFFSILKYGQIVGSQNKPIAQNTMFGWVVAGKIEPNCKSYHNIQSHFINSVNESNVDIILQKFWQTEEINQKTHLSEEEEFCETHFQSTYKFNKEGKFEVKLPIYKDVNLLGDSKPMAISRLFAMEKKFRFDKTLESDYKLFMKQYEELEHMTPIEKNFDSTSNKKYYLPHHSVIKSDSISTKLRVVFDGTCKPSNSNSLNSILAVGRNPQPDLFTILIKFRLNQIAFSADIQQMYRQIIISPEDQDLQCIVWRDSEQAEINEYKLTTVTYGTSSAPFLATRCLHELGNEVEVSDPVVSTIIKENFYIDDLMSGAISSEDSVEIINRLTTVLESRGFHLRKWRSNSSDVLDKLAINSAEPTNLEIHPDDCSKALGLLWDSKNDSFVFKVNLKFNDIITKRTFLSESAKLFDPLGFLSPCTISIKSFYQQLWLMKLDWDTPFPEELLMKMKAFQKEFEKVSIIRIPRWIQVVSNDLVCHGFCDASETAYAAIIYVVNYDITSKVTILVSKSKVAPLKPVSIPRLELNGALLLSRLYATLKNTVKLPISKFYAWTDSQVVLSWLSSHPRCWKPYIANRTAEILDSVPSDCWRYVPTKDNPADIASRGLSPKDLPDCSLWWEGPVWLSKTEKHWPEQPQLKVQSDAVTKEKKNKKLCFSLTLTNSFFDLFFEKYSSLTKIIDIVAFCIRFIENCKSKIRKSENFHVNYSKYCPLSTAERKNAGNLIILYIQQKYFADDIACLNSKRSLSKKSTLSVLCPFIDGDGFLRVGGRLENAPLQYNAKHPIILPNDHKFSMLIVHYFHILYMHAGLNVLLGIIRQLYWIINVKKLIKKCIHKCITCCRYRVVSSKQLMGDLPTDRVTPNRAFTACGIDYAGPINILKHRGRGARTTKGYIALFVCFATKAIHVELVSDMTADAFLASLKRFCARRGAPRNLYSDNGSNFVGAKRKLSDLSKLICTLNENENICYFLSQRHIEWHMIPPVSPHFGGLWEAAVKSVKFHIKRVIGNTNLTFEELYTFLTQVEAILNSRPLAALDSDSGDSPDSINILTPSHFLTGDVLTSPVEPFSEENLSLSSRWDIVQKMKLCFWKRWRIDYLSSLQNRRKWRISKENFKLNDVVIIKEDSVPPACWPLGKIVAIHPGRDGLVRVVSIKTARGLFKRPIVKLIVLPIHQE